MDTLNIVTISSQFLFNNYGPLSVQRNNRGGSAGYPLFSPSVLAYNNSLLLPGQKMVAPGTGCGVLTAAAAEQMGLAQTTQVATSIIDAHSGGLALVATEATSSEDFVGRLGMYIVLGMLFVIVRVENQVQ